MGFESLTYLGEATTASIALTWGFLQAARSFSEQCGYSGLVDVHAHLNRQGTNCILRSGMDYGADVSITNLPFRNKRMRWSSTIGTS